MWLTRLNWLLQIFCHSSTTIINSLPKLSLPINSFHKILSIHLPPSLGGLFHLQYNPLVMAQKRSILPCYLNLLLTSLKVGEVSFYHWPTRISCRPTTVTISQSSNQIKFMFTFRANVGETIENTILNKFFFAKTLFLQWSSSYLSICK